jgi:hypothetical protein
MFLPFGGCVVHNLPFIPGKQHWIKHWMSDAADQDAIA